MLYFGGRDSLALDRFQAGIRSRTGAEDLDAPVTIYTESFDEEGLGRSPLYAVAMEQFLRKKYAEREIDIVVPVGEYPLQFAQAKRKALFPSAKLIYLSMGYRRINLSRMRLGWCCESTSAPRARLR